MKNEAENVVKIKKIKNCEIMLELKRSHEDNPTEYKEKNGSPLTYWRANLQKRSASELKLDVVLISEQYQGIVSNGAWIPDVTNKTVLWICGKKIMQIGPINNKQCYVGAKVMCIYICYLPPSLKLVNYALIVDELPTEIN
uniref:Uncharacterized protein n=1 Tax=Glossina morsitans morsitans TaxID=37546 RepID=A0A1B0GDR5_GLOMM